MLLNNLLDLCLKFRRYNTLADLLEQLILGLEVLPEFSFPLCDLVNRNRVKETINTGVDNGNLDLSSKRLILALF
jgi:hypothetical protein